MNVHTHSHTFEQPMVGRLASDNKGMDSCLREGIGARCSINEPSHTHTQTHTQTHTHTHTETEETQETGDLIL